MEFIKSQKGKQLIVENGYIFEKNSLRLSGAEVCINGFTILNKFIANAENYCIYTKFIIGLALHYVL
jgi:hypothetical protein